MHDKYGKDGLVILTVTLDDPKDATARASVERYLGRTLAKGKKELPFRTLNLDVDPTKLPPTVNFGGGSPGVFVFNRENRYVKKLQPGESTPEAIEKAISELIKKK
jgi:hypothetical protein